MADLTVDTLLNLGFRDIAVWRLSKGDDGIEFHLDGQNAAADRLTLNEANALYSFVIGDDVMYIGKTVRSLRARLGGYQTPDRRQTTNWRCSGKIANALRSGHSVRILVFNPISHLRYGDFEINLAAGLEDSLIAEFRPPWNGREQGKIVTEEAEREKSDDADIPVNILDEAPVVEAPRTRNISIFDGSIPFRITLGQAYYVHGIINPGAEISARLGNDGEPIEINFEGESEPLVSRINRTANPNGSVRIVGHNLVIARWFQRHFKRGDVVEARVLDPHRIALLRK